MNQLPLLWAQESAIATPSMRVSWEFGREGWPGWIAAGAIVILLLAWLYRRDTRELSWYWRVWLGLLRSVVLAGLLIVALDPQERTETSQVRPSRVALLVDTSASMNFPEQTSTTPVNSTVTARTRIQAVQEALEKTSLLESLRKTHDVSVYHFDSQLQALVHLPKRQPLTTNPPVGSAKPTSASPPPKWSELLTARGTETRLGEALTQLIRETSGETLAGVGVFSDGQGNAGIDSLSAHDAALTAKTRLVTVGVGSTVKPINLQILNTQAPTHVHLGDSFSIATFVQGEGLVGKSVTVELLSKLENDQAPPASVEKKEAQLLEDGTPVTVSFDYLPVEPGRRMFTVRVKPLQPVQELTQDDNERPLPPIEISERKTKVLFIAGGPMRDYQFVRNLFHRDPTVELDVWLQTGVPGISQEAHEILQAFPADPAALFAYDVIFAFDPDWEKIPVPGREALVKWVTQQAGGLVFIAGKVFTGKLASGGEDLQNIRTLIPVVLRSTELDFDFSGDEYQQAWPMTFTPAGEQAEFLQVEDHPTASAEVWKQFPGIYRSYPTNGAKAGASVYAIHADRRVIDEQGKPILLAGQFFGAGRVLYLGSGELWRMRAIDEKYYERLWIKMLREVGQGRLLRGTNRGVLLLERQTYALGASIPIRAGLLDPQYQEYVTNSVPLEVVMPNGQRLVPPIPLQADQTRKGQYLGTLNVSQPGRYRLELAIPESTEQIVSYLQVEVPNLEYLKPAQDAAQLQRLATTELGGAYLPLADVVEKLPALFPDQSTTKIQFDTPRTLWDRDWVMYLLIGLLGVEWLTRKLLRLA